MGSDPIVFNIASFSMIYTRQKRICHNLWQNWSGSNYELSQALPNELCNGISTAGCSSMGAGGMGGENRSGNFLW